MREREKGRKSIFFSTKINTKECIVIKAFGCFPKVKCRFDVEVSSSWCFLSLSLFFYAMRERKKGQWRDREEERNKKKKCAWFGRFRLTYTRFDLNRLDLSIYILWIYNESNANKVLKEISNFKFWKEFKCLCATDGEIERVNEMQCVCVPYIERENEKKNPKWEFEKLIFETKQWMLC